MGGNIISQLLTLHPERFLTATLGGSAGRFHWTAKDDALMERQAVETEKWGFSPSARLEAGEALTDEQIRHDRLPFSPIQLEIVLPWPLLSAHSGNRWSLQNRLRESPSRH